MEFNLKDKNGNNLIVKIKSQVDGFIHCELYKEYRGSIFSLYKRKLKLVYDDFKFIDSIVKWERIDFVNWAENCVEIFNFKIEIE